MNSSYSSYQPCFYSYLTPPGYLLSAPLSQALVSRAPRGPWLCCLCQTGFAVSCAFCAPLRSHRMGRVGPSCNADGVRQLLVSCALVDGGRCPRLPFIFSEPRRNVPRCFARADVTAPPAWNLDAIRRYLRLSCAVDWIFEMTTRS